MQIENAMFLNKVKEQQEKSASFPASSASHYQTALLTIPTPATKSDGGGQAGSTAHLHPPHSTQNITVLPVPSTGIMTAGEPLCGWGGFLIFWWLLQRKSDTMSIHLHSQRNEAGIISHRSHKIILGSSRKPMNKHVCLSLCCSPETYITQYYYTHVTARSGT